MSDSVTLNGERTTQFPGCQCAAVQAKTVAFFAGCESVCEDLCQVLVLDPDTVVADLDTDMVLIGGDDQSQLCGITHQCGAEQSPGEQFFRSSENEVWEIGRAQRYENEDCQVNLVGNAKHALQKVDVTEKARTLSVRIWQHDEDAQIEAAAQAK